MEQTDQKLNIQRISLQEWKELMDSGYCDPVDVSTEGISMWPMLRSRGDGIKIVEPQKPLRVGDIIMFESKSGKIIAHRICWMGEGRLQTWGDNCTNKDEVITPDQIFGVVTHIRRKDKYIPVDTPFWHGYGRFMTVTCPFRMFIKDKLYHPVKKWLWRKLKGRK